MGMVFTLRMLSDICIYMFFATFVAGHMGLGGPPIIPVLIMAVCCGLSFLLRDRRRGLRLLPFALLAGLYFFISSPADLIVLVLPAGYIVYTAAKKYYYEHAADFRSRFSILIKIMPVVLIFGFAAGTPVMRDMSLPFGIMYLFSSVFLMRMLRQSEEILSQTRFRVINAVTLAATAALGLVISSPAVLAAIRMAITGAYSLLIAPIFMGLAYVFSFVGRLLTPLLNKLLARAGLEEMPTTALAEMGNEPEEMPLPVESEAFGRVMAVVFILMLIVIGVFFFRYMLGRRKPHNKGSGVVEERAPAAGGAGGASRRPSLFGGPRAQIRAIFRHFLDLCRSHGIDVYQSSTSLSVTRQAAPAFWCPEAEAWEIRDLYTQARYSDREITREDVKKMRQSYSAIKAYSKKQ